MMDYYEADVKLRDMGMMAGDAAAIQRAIKENDPAGGYDPGYLVRVIERQEAQGWKCDALRKHILMLRDGEHFVDKDGVLLEDEDE
jgi:hypothetical protein